MSGLNEAGLCSAAPPPGLESDTSALNQPDCLVYSSAQTSHPRRKNDARAVNQSNVQSKST